MAVENEKLERIKREREGTDDSVACFKGVLLEYKKIQDTGGDTAER